MDQPDELGRAGETNPFEVLGLEARFDLDAGVIESAWLRAAAMCHPDRVGEAASMGGRTIAAVNRAKGVLSDPEQRAEALLVLLGGAPRERDNSLPDGFLMDIFSVRQEMEEAVESGERARIAEFERWADGQREEYIRRVGELFARMGGRADGERLAETRRVLNGWRYIERMIEQLGG